MEILTLSYATLTKTYSDATASRSKAAPNPVSGGLRIGEPNDTFEQDTDRVTDEEMAGRSAKRHWSLASLGSGMPPQGDQGRTIPLSHAGAKLRHAQDQREASVLERGPVRFRLPTTADMKALFTSGNVPEDVLKNRVEMALVRMKKDSRLKTLDAVPDIMKKIFPSPGHFDEAEYEKAVDVTDRSRVYQNVLDAETQVTSADKPKLKTVIEDSAKLIDDCIADDANLQSVFGSKKAVAKAVYQKAKAALKNATLHIDSSVTTDYNLDDPETGLGGWAQFSTQKVHFQASVVKVTDEKAAKATIIHESSHLADESVDDKGYYARPGYDTASEDLKVTNAAHYEEIPRRKLGTSKFTNADGTFMDLKPASSGAPPTFEKKVRTKADDFLRRAWDKAVDVAKFIRDVRIQSLAGNNSLFASRRTRILEISKLMHLTIHEQPAATASVNQIDVVLAEGAARATNIFQGKAKALPVPQIADLHLPPMDPDAVPDDGTFPRRKSPPRGVIPIETDPRVAAYYMNQAENIAADKLANDAIKSYGALTGNDVDDRKLVDWLVAEYQKPI